MSTKTKIFDTAVKVFAKKGYEATSVDEIALKAKIAKGTIYYHFKSKEDIFFGLIERGLNLFTDVIIDKTSKVETPTEKLMVLLETQLDFFNKYRDFCRVLLGEFWRFETHWRKDIAKIEEGYISVVREIVDSGKASGEFKPELDTKATTTSLFGLMAVSSLDWAVFHKDIPRSEMLKTIQTIFLCGIKN